MLRLPTGSAASRSCCPSQKENPFKVKAYQRAAARIRNLPESLDEMVRDQEDLTVSPASARQLRVLFVRS